MHEKWSLLSVVHQLQHTIVIIIFPGNKTIPTHIPVLDDVPEDDPGAPEGDEGSGVREGDEGSGVREGDEGSGVREGSERPGVLEDSEDPGVFEGSEDPGVLEGSGTAITSRNSIAFKFTDIALNSSKCGHCLQDTG